MKILKIAGAAAGLLVALVAGFVVVTLVKSNRPTEAPYPAVAASNAPELLARGRYLVHGPSACGMCHLPKDRAMSLERGDEPSLVGGLELELPGFGTIRSPNITPDAATGIGSWTDAEIARMIRYGVDRDGHVSLSMSFTSGDVSDDDLAAIVSYLRSTPPVRTVDTPSERSFVYAAIVAWAFDPVAARPQAPATAPPAGPTVERGAYLANGPANCVGCHSRFDPVDFTLSRKFGGAEPHADPLDPTKEFVAPNLTTGEGGRLAAWAEGDFVGRFRAGKLIASSGMPWGPLSNMTDDDLKAIYAYLKTVPPVDYDPGPSHRPAGWTPRG